VIQLYACVICICRAALEQNEPLTEASEQVGFDDSAAISHVSDCSPLLHHIYIVYTYIGGSCSLRCSRAGA
jgi:hypothetical protein